MIEGFWDRNDVFDIHKCPKCYFYCCCSTPNLCTCCMGNDRRDDDYDFDFEDDQSQSDSEEMETTCVLN